MSHRVDLCDGFGGEVEEVADREQKDEIRADFGKCPRSTESGSSEDFRGSIRKQEKAKGLLKLPFAFHNGRQCRPFKEIRTILQLFEKGVA